MWHTFARQLANPRGVSGWVVGKLMKRANRQPTRLAIDALDIQNGDVVLDLGCGAGQAMAIMLPLAGRGGVHGIDQSETMVHEAARSNADAIRSARATVRLGHFENLPFPDAMFDRILASNVMYFWHDSDVVIREIRRVLKPGGTLAIYLTDAATMRGWKIASAGTHRLFGATAVAAALEDGGFACENISVAQVAITGGIAGLIALARS
jgi:arsenite methyltransferase